MKKIFRYLAVVAIAAAASACGHVTITTPAKDAHHIESHAQTIETEAELRAVEKLASEYEAAYRQAYGGAMAMKFKSLVEPMLISAGERRDEFRAAEEWLAQQQATLAKHINIMERAWCLEITTPEQDIAKIEANNQERTVLEANIETLTAVKDECSMRYFNALDTPEAETLREEFAKVNSDIESAEQEIDALNIDNEVIVLAYKLQRGEELIVACDEECCTECGDAAECGDIMECSDDEDEE